MVKFRFASQQTEGTLFRHTFGCAFLFREVFIISRELPIKRVVVAGCRDYYNYDEAKSYIDYCISNIRKENIIVIVSGGASGADALGERYAKENGFDIERYPADWQTYGRSAGPKRNKKWQKWGTI